MHTVWPPSVSEPEKRVQRAAAQFLISQPNFSTTGPQFAFNVCSLLGCKQVGELGIKERFTAVLQREPELFLFRAGRCPAQYIVDLQASELLHRANMQRQQPHSTQGRQPPNSQCGTVGTSSSSSQQQNGSSVPPQQPPQQGPTNQPPQELPNMQCLPLPHSLRLLAGLSMQECASALTCLVLAPTENEVLPNPQAVPTPKLRQILQHVNKAKLMALDLEFAQVIPPAQQQLLPKQLQQRQSPQAATLRCRPDACFDQLALLQLFVPAAGIHSSCIYLVEVPQQRQAAAAVMQHLQPLLEDEAVVKVMHDSRQDSVVLKLQFGISLRGVLDTQLLAGCAQLAGSVYMPGNNAMGSSSSTQTAGNSSLAGSSGAFNAAAKTAATGAPHLGRIGLGKLYDKYGCPHPTKDKMCQAFDSDPR